MVEHGFKRAVGKPNFNDQFKKMIKRYKKKLDITCISCDSQRGWSKTPLTVYCYGFHFNCTSGLRLNDGSGVKL